MYLITSYKETSKGININGAKLYLISNDQSDAVLVCDIQQATAKGWRSNKAILVDFDYTVNTTDLVCTALEISDEVAARLIATYKDVQVKIYSTWQPDRKAGVILALCEYIHDPWDTN